MQRLGAHRAGAITWVNNEANSACPPVGPTSGSTACSGCGIRPTTFRSGSGSRRSLGRPVQVVVLGRLAVGPAVAERPALGLQPIEDIVGSDELALAVFDRDLEDLARRHVRRDGGLRRLDAQMDDAAHEPERSLRISAPGSSPDSHRIWKPLQMPITDRRPRRTSEPPPSPARTGRSRRIGGSRRS